MKAFEGETLQSVWPQIIKRIMKNGEVIVDQRGSKTKELLNIVWTINNPEASEIPEGYPMGPNSVKEYENQFLDPEKGTFVYTYGERLNRYIIFKPDQPTKKDLEKLKRAKKASDVKLPGQLFFVNQIQKCIKDLKESPNTRRAIGVTWKLPEDFVEEEVPCFIMVSFLIRNGKLFTSAVWRSHDALGGMPANFIALRKLSRHVADEVGVKVGSITIQSVSAHIYETDWEAARKIK